MMPLRIIALLILIAPAVKAKQLNWEVLPGECVVAIEGESCEATVTIKIHSPIIRPLCLTIDRQKKKCFSANMTQQRHDLVIQKDVVFSLVQTDNQLVDQYVLRYQIIDPAPRRRRVRLPWSIF